MKRSLLATALLIAGCTSFQGGRSLETLPTPLPADERIEFWSRGEAYQLHAVTIDTDSVRGVRWWHSPDCDSCRVVIARAEVDSIRTKRPDGGQTGVLTLILTPVILVAYFILNFPSD